MNIGIWILRHKLYVASVIVVSVLTSLSIYNGYWVWDAYTNDNIITTTTVRTSRNIYPFSKYMTVAYTFANNTIFPETWNMSEKRLERYLPREDFRSDGWYAIQRLERRIRDVYRTDRYATSVASNNFSLNKALDVATMTDIISFLDTKFLVGFTRHDIFGENAGDPIQFRDFFINASQRTAAAHSERFYRVPAIDLYPDVAKVIDAFIANPQSKESIDRTLTRIRGETDQFVRLLYPHIPSQPYVPITFLVDQLTYRSIQFLIPLDFVENITTSTIKLEILPFNSSISPPPLELLHQSFSRFKVPGIIGMNIDAPHTSLDTSFLLAIINYQNEGIYNTTDIKARCILRLYVLMSLKTKFS